MTNLINQRFNKIDSIFFYLCMIFLNEIIAFEIIFVIIFVKLIFILIR